MIIRMRRVFILLIVKVGFKAFNSSWNRVGEPQVDVEERTDISGWGS